METRKQIKEAILNGHFYDFITSHQHEISKDEFLYLVKEFDFTVYQDNFYSYEDFCKKVVENLTDAGFFDELL